jgi:hypothetical protein
MYLLPKEVGNTYLAPSEKYMRTRSPTSTHAGDRPKGKAGAERPLFKRPLLARRGDRREAQQHEGPYASHRASRVLGEPFLTDHLARLYIQW